MIFSIDPGPVKSAIMRYDQGHLEQFGIFENRVVLDILRMGDHLSEKLVVEMIASYGMPVGAEVFNTCFWIGRFVEAHAMNGGRCELAYRKDIKIHFCGTMKANDATIRQVLIDRFGPGKDFAVGTKKSPGPLYGVSKDVWSALAIAVYATDIEKRAALTPAKSV